MSPLMTETDTDINKYPNSKKKVNITNPLALDEDSIARKKRNRPMNIGDDNDPTGNSAAYGSDTRGDPSEARQKDEFLPFDNKSNSFPFPEGKYSLIKELKEKLFPEYEEPNGGAEAGYPSNGNNSYAFDGILNAPEDSPFSTMNRALEKITNKPTLPIENRLRSQDLFSPTKKLLR